MKIKIYSLLTLLAIVFSVQAQDYLNLNKNGKVILRTPISAIDSILFKKEGDVTPTNLYIYKNGVITTQKGLTDFDSLYFQHIDVKDFEGYTYKTVLIGTQLWMAENLRTTTFRDGKEIPLFGYGDADKAAWVSQGENKKPAMSWYFGDKDTYAQYGGLYNGYAVTSGLLCPTGWHIPNEDEWNSLTEFLGGKDVAGGKLKEAGTTHWSDPNTDATNSSGFTAFGSGFRYEDGGWGVLKWYTTLWSAPQSIDYSYYRSLSYNDAKVFGSYTTNSKGYSVRCLKD